jgi:hypothetical protein
MPYPLQHLSRATACLLLACAAAGAGAADFLGTRPAHVPADPGPVENEQAITARIWAPEIDAGYVPQGISFADGQVLVSSYRSADSSVGRGPCRVHRVDAKSGKTTGQFDLPADCGHAGGAVYAGKGVLIVADTRRLYKIDLEKAFASGQARDGLLATLTLAGEVKGSFVDFDGTSILVGSYEKEAEKAKVHFLPYTLFDTKDGQTVDEQAATRSFPILVRAQGAAFDRQGALWLTASSSNFGMLQKVDPVSGKVLAQHDMVAGIEDIGFDPEGRLWGVSEAGSLRWSRWSRTYPVIFALDVSKLSKP